MRTLDDLRDPRLVEELFHILENRVCIALAVHLLHEVLLLVVIDDWQGVIDECLEALLQTLLVVVGSVAAQASLQATLHADLFLALEHQHELQINLLGHLLVPSVQIVLVPWESVDQEVVLVRVLQVDRGTGFIS